MNFLWERKHSHYIPCYTGDVVFIIEQFCIETYTLFYLSINVNKIQQEIIQV